jgi:molybdopterin converting factor small subunit
LRISFRLPFPSELRKLKRSCPGDTGAFLFDVQFATREKSKPVRIFNTMTVRVLLFASYADAVGRNELTLDIADGCVVADVVEKVRALAGGRVLPPSPLLALNATYASPGAEVRSGDEVAIIPPVAGG